VGATWLLLLFRKVKGSNYMNRYFDIPRDRMTLQIEVTSEGMRYTVDQMEKLLKITGLREISLREYKVLSDEYTKPLMQ